ncbi:alpha-amylase [Spirochaetia bacterium]|nr:alpha-amylase [Spirochaetia bacterium]
MKICLALCVILLFSCIEDPKSTYIPPLGGHSEGTWYQIFPVSFYDSNGDGIGDINGITQKLDYLNDTVTAAHKSRTATGGDCDESLHVAGIWLTPVMPSPSYHKYDTKDYMDIDPTLGTLDDFRHLISEAHKRGIKVIIDFVMNHSSEQHPWFQKALEEVRAGKPGRYASYYHFYYGATPPENYKFKTADSNYQSSYYKWWGKAAENAWFEGSFWTGMPDLNWDSVALRKEFERIVEFWLSAGLDGFRLDATSWPYNYRGMERDSDGINGEEKNIELWTWFNKTCQRYNPNVYLIGECWEGEDTIANYYRSGMNYFAFQFSTQNGGGGTIKWGAEEHGEDFVKGLYYWDQKIKIRNPNAISAPFLSNHDQTRSAMYLGENQRKMAASLLVFSPGTPFLYYGEEIGLTSPTYESPDANRRGTMCWSWPKVAGMPDPPPEWNWWQATPESGQGVMQQLKDPGSLLRYYIRANNLKNKYPWIAYGSIEMFPVTDFHVAAYRMTDTDPESDTYRKSVVIVHNTDPGAGHGIAFDPGTISRHFGFSVSGWGVPDPTSFTGGTFTLDPYSTVVFEEVTP